jgi:DNA modification methylase
MASDKNQRVTAKVHPNKSIETAWWPIARPKPYARNARKIPQEAVDKVALSIREYGWQQPIVVDEQDVILAGHARLLAARQLNLAQVPVHVAAGLTAEQCRAYRLMDNRSHQETTWDMDLLGPELLELQALGVDLMLTGFDLGEIAQPGTAGLTDPDAVPEVPLVPVTQPGDLWLLGKHRLICGDCRDTNVVKLLMAGQVANVAVTSPPYASQREYDASSGFKPIPPDEYVDWYRAVAAGIETVLAADGSYFLNIKEHAQDGQRSLYVKDMTLAHVRQWGWMFVDEFCWRKTDNGVPGGWPNRFKNAWEPVFHFTRQSEIKFRPKTVGHISDDCFDYSPDNPKSTSGSGLLGTGKRGGMASENTATGSAMRRTRASDESGRFTDIARPSNVIECKTESTQGSHSAPFPRALVEFFIKAVSDEGDIVFDPFMGSGTTLAAAHVLNRAGYGCEISPAYCDVIVKRWQGFTGQEATLEGHGSTFDHVAHGRQLGREDHDKDDALRLIEERCAS